MKKIVFIISMIFSFNVFAANIEATVNKNIVSQDEVFVFTLTADENVNERPDLSALSTNFKVYSNFGGKYSAYVPQCFLRWFDDIDPEIAKDHKQFKKDISKLVLCEKRRALVVEHEDEVIHSDQKLVIEKERKKLRL